MTSPRTALQRSRERASNSAPTNQSPPRLSHHLADLSLTPLFSSNTSETSYHALTTLTTSALSAHTSASRLGLGAPLRIMIETADKGPVVLHSFLDPRAEEGDANGTGHPRIDASGFLDIGRLPDVHAFSAEPTIPISGHPNERIDQGEGGDADAVTNGMDALHLVPSTETGDTGEEKETSAPMLIGTVVVDGYNHMREARRAASKLEALGRGVQEEWRRENESQEAEPAEGG